MIDLSLMSKQEKIIIASLMLAIVIVILIMFNPANVRNERKAAAEPQNILSGGGAPGADKGYFQTPKDIAVDNEGNVYVVDSKNHRIQKFNSSGVFLLAWGKEGNAPGDFKEPCGIDLGPDNNIYVADTWNGRVQVFTPSGSFVQAMGGELGLWGPRDVAVDKDGNVYILDTGNCLMYKLDKAGRMITAIGKKGGGKKDGEFTEPFSIKQGPDGNLYVADRKNFRIQVLSTTGKYIRQFKVDGWSPDQVAGGCLMEPYLTIDDKKSEVYITDSTNHRVIRCNLSGGGVKTITTDAKGAKLQCPLGVAVFINGQLLITDAAAGKIMTLQVQ